MGKFDTHGGYFAPQNYFKVNEGGSHGENPNGGVQIGMDEQGIPNMLEEGEPVYNDYVYSDNIKLDKRLCKEFKIPEKYAGRLYSEVADSLVDEASERPLDPISNNGIEAMLSRLANMQDEQKRRRDERSVKTGMSDLTPEELDMLTQEIGQQQNGATEEAASDMQEVYPQGQDEYQQEEQVSAQEPQIDPSQVQPQQMDGSQMMADGGLMRTFKDGDPGTVQEPKGSRAYRREQAKEAARADAVAQAILNQNSQEQAARNGMYRELTDENGNTVAVPSEQPLVNEDYLLGAGAALGAGALAGASFAPLNTALWATGVPGAIKGLQDTGEKIVHGTYDLSDVPGTVLDAAMMTPIMRGFSMYGKAANAANKTMGIVDNSVRGTKTAGNVGKAVGTAEANLAKAGNAIGNAAEKGWEGVKTVGKGMADSYKENIKEPVKKFVEKTGKSIKANKEARKEAYWTERLKALGENEDVKASKKAFFKKNKIDYASLDDAGKAAADEEFAYQFLADKARLVPLEARNKFAQEVGYADEAAARANPEDAKAFDKLLYEKYGIREANGQIAQPKHNIGTHVFNGLFNPIYAPRRINNAVKQKGWSGAKGTAAKIGGDILGLGALGNDVHIVSKIGGAAHDALSNREYRKSNNKSNNNGFSSSIDDNLNFEASGGPIQRKFNTGSPGLYAASPSYNALAYANGRRPLVIGNSTAANLGLGMQNIFPSARIVPDIVSYYYNTNGQRTFLPTVNDEYGPIGPPNPNLVGPPAPGTPEYADLAAGNATADSNAPSKRKGTSNVVPTNLRNAGIETQEYKDAQKAIEDDMFRSLFGFDLNDPLKRPEKAEANLGYGVLSGGKYSGGRPVEAISPKVGQEVEGVDVPVGYNTRFDKKGDETSEPGNGRKYLSTFPRYAGAITNGVLGLYNVFQKPDHYDYQQYNPVLPTGRLSLQNPEYNPYDQNLGINALNAGRAGTNRTVLNSGQGPSLGAALVAADYTYGKNMGDYLTNVWNQNNVMRNSVTSQRNQNAQAQANFDYGLNTARANAINDARLRNMQNYQYTQRLNNAAESEKYAALQTQIDNMSKALAGIGQENFATNQLNSNSSIDYKHMGNGIYGYGKKGGKLKRR